MRNIRGLNSAEQKLVEDLVTVIEKKRARNQLRSRYMNGKHVLRNLPPTAPPYLKNLNTVLGWPAKAVEMLARRIRLEAFSLPGSDLGGLTEILEANDYFAASSQAQVSSLVHSTVFQTVTAGGVGEPDAVISHVSALHGTGQWDPRKKSLVNFLAVSENGKHDEGAGSIGDLGSTGAFTLFLDHEIITVEDGVVVSRAPSLVRMPVVQLPYKPRLDRPFGTSRISRAVMTLTDAGVRTLMRSEGTADFYGAPWFILYGPGEDAFSKDAWQLIMDRVNVIPDNDDAANPRAQVQQFSQASQEPHVSQLQVLAGLFAGETNIPISSLGIGLTQANPPSAEAYIASREDLIAEAEDAKRAWSRPHKLTALWAWQIAQGSTDIPEGFEGLNVEWGDTRYTSHAAKADAVTKLVASFPWMSESDAVLDSLGLDSGLTARLKADKRRAQGQVVLRQLGADGGIPDRVGDTSPQP